MTDPTTARAGYEKRDISVRVVAWFGLGLVVTAIIIHGAILGLYALFAHRHPSPDSPSRIVLQPHMIAPEPQLQTNPSIDLAQFQAAQNAKLNSYGWIDRNAGVIRIPIERAMDLIAQRGLPTRGAGTPDASGVTSVQMQERKAAATNR